jgi:hypothetical protein
MALYHAYGFRGSHRPAAIETNRSQSHSRDASCCMLSLNGVEVPGTHITSVTGPGGAFADPIEPALSNTVVVQVTSANSLLRLANGELAVGHLDTVADSTTASLNVIRLS